MNMIDLQLYRFRVGIFNRCLVRQVGLGTGTCDPYSKYLLISKFSLLSCFYIYFILCMLGTTLSMISESKLKLFCINRFHQITDMEALNCCLSHVKILSAILISFLITRDCIVYKHLGCFIGLLKYLIGSKPPLCHNVDGNFSKLVNKIISLCYQVILWVYLINSVMIVVVNPGLLNPGPNNRLNIMSFNCQGLIPFSQLAEKNPMLDVTKVYELNHFICKHNPDILMLNKTWLKGSIQSSEFLPTDVYKIFRLDRSRKTHPMDPSDPKKYRAYGGGVLIAIRRDLDIKSTPLDFQCAAEILAVTLTFSNGKKLVLSSFYRVKNLGVANHNEFETFFKKARSRRGVAGIIVVGDINLPDVNWENYSSPNNIEQMFLDSFSNFGLEQIVRTSTHIKGNTLDLILTDKPQLLSDLKVTAINLPCKSDHYNTSFQVNTKIKRIKDPKGRFIILKKQTGIV